MNAMVMELLTALIVTELEKSKQKRKKRQMSEPRFTLTPEGTVHDKEKNVHYHKGQIITLLNHYEEIRKSYLRAINTYLQKKDEARILSELRDLNQKYESLHVEIHEEDNFYKKWLEVKDWNYKDPEIQTKKIFPHAHIFMKEEENFRIELWDNHPLCQKVRDLDTSKTCLGAWRTAWEIIDAYFKAKDGSQ